MTLKEVAEQKSENYVKYALGDTPNADEAFSAKEDFQAGFISGYELNAKALDFCRHQLKYIAAQAQDKGEKETVLLLMHVLERMR